MVVRGGDEVVKIAARVNQVSNCALGGGRAGGRCEERSLEPGLRRVAGEGRR